MQIKGDKKDDTLRLKLLLLGEADIGKTSVMERYVNNCFKNYLPTIGLDIRKKFLEINKCDIDVTINDTPGQERFRSLTKMLYKGADGILLGFDLTNKHTFETINYWFEQIEQNKNKDFPVNLVLFGNKCDKKEEIVVNNDDIELLKKKYNFQYFATSAKDGTNVQNAFEYIIKATIKAKGLLEKIGLSPDIPFDDIEIKVKENQKIEVKHVLKRKKKKPCI